MDVSSAPCVLQVEVSKRDNHTMAFFNDDFKRVAVLPRSPEQFRGHLAMHVYSTSGLAHRRRSNNPRWASHINTLLSLGITFFHGGGYYGGP